MSEMSYDLNALVSAKAASEIIKLLQAGNGKLVHLIPANGHGRSNGSNGKTLAYNGIARDLILSTLRTGKAMPRPTLVKALKAKGYSPKSIGPICTMLKRDGKIRSPRRGYWQLAA